MRKNMISSSVAAISPSATEKTSSLANQMKRSGIDIVSFAQGEPDFETPENIKQAGIDAIRSGFTRYTDVPGILELKEAVCRKFLRENSISYSPDEVLISNGGKQALYNLFRTICEDGDEVLIPTPAYVSYVEQIKLTGAKPVFFQTQEKNNFSPTFEEIKVHCTDKTRAFILNTPNNPSGSVCPVSELKKIAEFMVSNKILMITDEVYEHLVYDGVKHVSIAALSEEAKKWSIIVNSVSKTYAMTGWRVGYLAGPKEIISAIGNLQGHVTGNVNSIAQKATVEALDGPQDSVRSMVSEYARRRSYMVKRINSIEGLHCVKPDGAFYCFTNVKGLIGARKGDLVIENDMDVATYFLEEAHVAVVPGVAFSYPGYVRFVFAKSLEEISEGLDRIERAVGGLSFPDHS